MKKSLIVVLFLVSGLLLSCVKPPPPANKPIGEVSIYAYDSELIDSTVSIFAVDKNMQKTGELIASGTTNEFGQIKLTLEIESQYIWIEVGSRGYYIEEATGTKIDLAPTDKLTSINYYTAGENVTLSVTGFSHIATAYALCSIKRFGVENSDAMSQAATAFKDFTSINVFSEIPVNPAISTSTGLHVNESLTYGVLAAAVSQYMTEVSRDNEIDPHTDNYRSIDFYNYAAKDILEDKFCALDGKIQNRNGLEINVGIGNTVFSSNTYRVDLARAALYFLTTDKNKTAIEIDQFLPVAKILASIENARLFAGEQPVPLDSDGPTISLHYPEDLYIGGFFDYSVSASDYVGLKSIELLLDNVSLGQSQYERESVFRAINTSEYLDGVHTFKIIATDTQDHISTLEHSVMIWNAGAIIERYTAQKTNSLAYELGLNITSPIDIQTAHVNNELVTVNDKKILVNINLSPGINNIPVQVKDNVGNVTEVNVELHVDTQPPIATILTPNPLYEVNYSEDSFVHQKYLSLQDLTDNAVDPLYYDDTIVSLNGTANTKQNLMALKIPFIEFAISDDSGNQDIKVITPKADLEATFSYFVDEKTVFENKNLLPMGDGSLTGIYQLPLTVEYLGENWFMSKSEAIHRVVLHIKDIPGNIKNHPFEFKVRYFPGQANVTFSEVLTRYIQNTISQLPSVNDREKVFSYSFENDYNFPLSIDLAATQEGTVNYQYMSGIREAQIEKHELGFARVTCAKSVTGIDGFNAWYGNHKSGDEIYVNENGWQIRGAKFGLPYFQAAEIKFINRTNSLPHYSDGLPANENVIFDPQNSVDDMGYKHVTITARNEDTNNPQNSYIEYTKNYFVLYDAEDRARCPLLTKSVRIEGSTNVSIWNSKIDFPSSIISRTEKVTHSFVEGFPKDTVNKIKEVTNVKLDIKYHVNDVAIEPNENLEVELNPTDRLLTTLSVPFPNIELKGSDCTWEYSVQKECDKQVMITAPSEVTFGVQPATAEHQLPKAIYTVDNGDVISIID